MLLKRLSILVAAVFGLAVVVVPVHAQNITRDYDQDPNSNDAYDRARIDRYLDVEVWVNHSDGEYFEGDQIVVSYRANRDAFVVIYSIDTRGRVNLLFPSAPGEDNFVRGGVTYHLPSAYDDFDLIVSGPEGVEHIQIIASRDRIPVPDWYPTSGLICDWDDRFDYMDYVNGRYFVRYDGQLFAYDRASVYVNEWEPYYFRPVYYPSYYPWTVCGNVYIDYPIGATIYIDGVYWGCAPLYIPRIYVGWHTFTVYDHYGYCWEYDCHVARHHTVVLGHDIIRTSPSVVSKYKEVRFSGYRSPEASGYPQFKEKHQAILTSGAVTKKPVRDVDPSVSKKTETILTGTKKYAVGGAKLVKTDRGYETTGMLPGSSVRNERQQNRAETGTSARDTEKKTYYEDGSIPPSKESVRSERITRSTEKRDQTTTGRARPESESKPSSEYYRKQSGSSYKTSKQLLKEKVQTKESSRARQSESGKSAKNVKPAPKSSGSSKETGKSGGSNKSSVSTRSGGSMSPGGKASAPSGNSKASTGSKPVSGGGKGKR